MHNKSKKKIIKSYRTNATTITKSNKKQILSNGIINEHFFLKQESKSQNIFMCNGISFIKHCAYIYITDGWYSGVFIYIFVYKKVLQTISINHLKSNITHIHMCNVFLGYCCTSIFFIVNFSLNNLWYTTEILGCHCYYFEV